MNRLFIYDEIAEFFSYRREMDNPRFETILCTLEYEGLYADVKRFVEKQNHHMDNHISFITKKGVIYRYSDHKLLIGKPTIKK